MIITLQNTTQLEKDYFSRVDTVNSTSNRSADAWKVYDAVWSIAHVLKSSMSKLGKPLENVTYGDPIAGQLFYNETVKLVFESPNMVSEPLHGMFIDFIYFCTINSIECQH